MPTPAQLAVQTARFYEWERLGRGVTVYPHLVALESEFRPFPGHSPARLSRQDDGHRPTIVSRILERIGGKTDTQNHTAPQSTEDDASIVEASLPTRIPAEFEILIPSDAKIPSATCTRLIHALSGATAPLAYELIATGGKVSLRLACSADDERLVRAQLAAHIPSATVTPTQHRLIQMWRACEAEFSACATFSLAREFMIPLSLKDSGASALSAVIGALSQTGDGELGIFQVLFAPAQYPWAANAIEAVYSPNGDPFFIDAPDISKLAEEKLIQPLFAVAVRAMVHFRDENNAEAILRGIATAFESDDSRRNSFVPLAPDELDDYQANVLIRCTNQSGMILSLAELASIACLPSAEIRAPALLRTSVITRLPAEIIGARGISIGTAEHAGERAPVHLPLEARLNHTYVIGASGTGKSTLLEQMILQDIAAGSGLAVVDPHGDLVDAVLSRIPDERVQDVVLFDPSDPDWVVGWNILGANSETEKQMLASDLVATWKRLSTTWGDQMNAVLSNAVLAFLESSVGGTLSDLRQFLLDDKFRAAFLSTVGDEHVRSFWKDEFPMLAPRKPQAPILTRLDVLLRSRLVREAVVERERALDFRAIMDGKKIFLAKLAQGAIGEENAALLGSLLVSKFHQTALSRQDEAHESREPFFLYVDEFQDMATPSMASLFSGVRKYKLAMCVAHQDLFQLHSASPELERSVLANAYTRIAFRLSEDDARRVERGMGEFGEEDLINLNRGEAICRVGRRANVFRLATLPLDPIERAPAREARERVRQASVAHYGRQRQSDSVAGGTDFPVAKRVDDAPPGRGGRQHKYLQRLIKKAAEQRGFEASIEKRVLNGHGHVDVALAIAGISIACEISITTGVEHELQNLVKCLTAGFDHAFLVASDERTLMEAESRMATESPSYSIDRMRFLTPSSLFAVLDEFAASARRSQTDNVVTGSTAHSRIRKQGDISVASAETDSQSLLDVDQTSLYVRRAPQTLAKLRSIGGGPAFHKIGRNIYYRRSDLDDWLAQRRRRSTSE